MDNERNNPIDLQKERSSEPNNENNGYPENDPSTARPIFSNPFPAEEGPLKQSGLGIASFILALLAVVLVIVAIVFGTVFADQIIDNEVLLDSSDPNAMMEVIGEESMVPVMMAGLSIIAAIGVAFVGLILGIIGAFSKNRRKVFSVIGIILNGLLVVGAVGLVVVGIALGAAGAA
ncbi:hypothetical protein L1N85_18250 [Paenibacillus alkaliterrae]|uniref:hypothetical protein n=1 Tax=Paenibacillus alkaliterrae TaxID=320909 RepID=UPI001F296B3E|nr:hypothetical protein [Paenibacillus alkaliterrae]MCF2940347.1 hypothetical protein [Paenibacillus alkaliterrae]